MIVKRFPSIKKTFGNMEKMINHLLFSALALYRPKVVHGRNPYDCYLYLKRSRNAVVLGRVASHSPSINMFCGDKSADLSDRDERLSNR